MGQSGMAPGISLAARGNSVSWFCTVSVSAQNGIKATQKDPYLLRPISQHSPESCPKTVPVTLWLDAAPTQPRRTICFLHPSFFKAITAVRLSGMSIFRKFLKPLSTSTLPSCRLVVMFDALALCFCKETLWQLLKLKPLTPISVYRLLQWNVTFPQVTSYIQSDIFIAWYLFFFVNECVHVCGNVHVCICVCVRKCKRLHACVAACAHINLEPVCFAHTHKKKHRNFSV